VPSPHVIIPDYRVAAIESLRGEFFTSLIDIDFMVTISQIIISQHIQADPAVRLIYHNLLFHGYLVDRSQNNTVTTAAWDEYLHCLRSISLWWEKPSNTSTLMDLIAGGISSWSALQNLDYELAWNLHRRTCRIAKALGLLHLDQQPSQAALPSLPTPPHLGASTFRNQLRWGFWTLVISDLLFRLLFNRPSCISAEASCEGIRLPDSADVKSERPMASVHATQTVWGRLTFIAKDFFDMVDRGLHLDPDAAEQSGRFRMKVDEACEEIRLMVADWHLVRPHRLRSSSSLGPDADEMLCR
jgi:hypothetical protein